MNRFLFATLLFWVLAAGCSHVIPPQARDQVDPALEFSDVRENAEAHVGKTLLLGGLIVAAQVARAGSELEILRYSLDRWGRPLDPDEASGRFLVRSERILDPALYESGRLVTLTGQVAGEETRALGESTYRYPVFRLTAIYLWPQQDRYLDPRGYSPYVYPYFPYYHWYSPYGPWPYDRY